MQLMTRNPIETEALGERIGSAAESGDVILLAGELGAGKTCLARGIARGLGSPDHVSSPSFVLVNEYRGRVPMFHVDLYRLENADADAEILGLWDQAEEGLLVVEWPERGIGALPPATLLVKIDYGEEPNERQVSLRASSPRGEQLASSAELVR